MSVGDQIETSSSRLSEDDRSSKALETSLPSHETSEGSSWDFVGTSCLQSIAFHLSVGPSTLQKTQFQPPSFHPSKHELQSLEASKPRLPWMSRINLLLTYLWRCSACNQNSQNSYKMHQVMSPLIQNKYRL